MLVLTRQLAQKILILKDGEVVGSITLISTSPGKARIGLDGVFNYVREEVHLREKESPCTPKSASTFEKPQS